MRHLLDINVLIALFDPDHTFHQRAHEWWAPGSLLWASCPLTENGMIRIMSSPHYSPTSRFSVSELGTRLAQFTRSTNHQFWPGTLSILNTSRFALQQVVSSKQITDLYLLGLACKKGGCLVTFDHCIPRNAVIGAERNHLLIL